jgi:hypothetical protein
MPNETGSQEKPDYQAPWTYEHLFLMRRNRDVSYFWVRLLMRCFNT